MKAFILAAGLGTRLAPLTNDRPKALVEINGINMLERLIINLKKTGITEILVNVHHHAQSVIDFINSKNWNELNISISNESKVLLNTGGAIDNAKDFFKGDENILIHNVDIITEVDFAELQKQHIQSGSLVSLCVRNRESSRGLLFDLDNKLCGWTNNSTSEFKWVNDKTSDFKQKAYSGVYLASPEFASKIPLSGSFSIIDAWLEMAKKENISAFHDNSENWFDLGTKEKIKIAETYLKNEKESKKFLEKVADELCLLSKKELLNTAIILPNKRSVTFLKKYFMKSRVNPLWLPDFCSIDEFMESLANISKSDPLNLYFDLYEIHKKREGNSARNIDKYLSWAPMIIRDFNDIDLYLSNAKDVLSSISEAHAMEEWNLDRQELTELQKSYINFFQSLYGYYLDLKTKMLEKSSAYTGFIYRHNAENIEDLAKKSKWNNYVYVGFNALSPSEEKVFGYLKDNYKTSVFFDADKYYINKQENIPSQEAGTNLKRLINKWKLKDFNWLGNKLLKQEKNINFFDVQGQIGQVKLAGDVLQKILNSEFSKNIEQNNQTENNGISNQLTISDTAIVLADENLLLPLLGSLPNSYEGSKDGPIYNVTLGYPINYSPLKGFVHDWFNLLINRFNNQNQQFRTKEIQNLFLNSVLNSSLDILVQNQIKDISSKFIVNNISYVSHSEIMEMVKSEEEKNFFNLLFGETKDISTLLNKLVDVLLVFGKGLNENNANNIILKEQIILFLKISKRLNISNIKSFEQLDIKSFSTLFFQLLSSYEISLKGEPLSGIQIMGMLETRALDFKNLIILSANEGILPQAGIPDSFIPFDIRSTYGLPLPKDKNSVLSYHFFRLLQHAENINIIYNTSSEGIGSGEPSRFLRQIELELSKLNTNITLSHNNLTISGGESNKEIKISKNQKSIEIIRKKAINGFSPSLLNTYVSCKLKFYFQYVLKLERENEIEASVESHTFGSIIHDTLEELYSPFIGKNIDKEILKKSLVKLDDLLTKYFVKHFKTQNFKQGRNLLIWEVSKKYIKNFVFSELNELKEKQRTIIGLEEKIKLKISNRKDEVFLNGIIDRIDSDNEGRTIRIVDYKTGNVLANQLKLNEMDLLLSDNKYSKAFQVLFYKYLYLKSFKGREEESITTGIISIRNLSSGFLEFILNNEHENTMEEFEEILNSLIDEIFDAEVDFCQTSDNKVCSYCDFKNICNR
jgi:NDP-sugar pyrophosphorylase family protein/CRISPR/Cas system-associated exonuclease Cas4 (RecB family)